MTRDVADKPHSSVPLSNPLHTLLHLSLHPFPPSPLRHPVPPLLPSRQGSSQRWRRRQEQRCVNINKSKQSHRGWAGLRRGWRGDGQERLSSFLSFLLHLSPPVEVVVEALKEKEPLHKQMPGIRLQPGECVNSFSSAINTPQLRIGAFAKCN